MEENITMKNGDGSGSRTVAEEPVSYLAKDYERWKLLYARQPAMTRRFLKARRRRWRTR